MTVKLWMAVAALVCSCSRTPPPKIDAPQEGTKPSLTEQGVGSGASAGGPLADSSKISPTDSAVGAVTTDTQSDDAAAATKSDDKSDAELKSTAEGTPPADSSTNGTSGNGTASGLANRNTLNDVADGEAEKLIGTWTGATDVAPTNLAFTTIPAAALATNPLPGVSPTPTIPQTSPAPQATPNGQLPGSNIGTQPGVPGVQPGTQPGVQPGIQPGVRPGAGGGW